MFQFLRSLDFKGGVLFGNGRKALLRPNLWETATERESKRPFSVLSLLHILTGLRDLKNSTCHSGAGGHPTACSLEWITQQVGPTSGDVARALRRFVGMIQEAISIIDRLITLLGHRELHRRQVFNDFLDPLFTDMTTIHADYRRVFSQVSALLAASSSDSDIGKQLKTSKRELELLRQKTYSLVNALN